MKVDSFVLMNALENVGSSRPVGELEFIKTLLIDVQGVPLFEVFDRHVLNNIGNLSVCVFESKLSFQLLLLQLMQVAFVLLCVCAFIPSLLLDICICQAFWHLLCLQAVVQRISVKQKWP